MTETEVTTKDPQGNPVEAPSDQEPNDPTVPQKTVPPLPEEEKEHRQDKVPDPEE
jgi:hypothetical protein